MSIQGWAKAEERFPGLNLALARSGALEVELSSIIGFL